MGSAIHPVGMGFQSASGIALIGSRTLLTWQMVVEKLTSSLRRTDTTLWV